MSNIEDIINKETWSEKFDDIKGQYKTSYKEEVESFYYRLFKESQKIFDRDIFNSDSKVLSEKVQNELQTFSMYYQIKGLIESTSYDEAKARVIKDTGMKEDEFEILIAKGHLLETMIIFPRVSEFCADILILHKEFKQEIEENDES